MRRVSIFIRKLWKSHLEIDGFPSIHHINNLISHEQKAGKIRNSQSRQMLQTMMRHQTIESSTNLLCFTIALEVKKKRHHNILFPWILSFVLCAVMCGSMFSHRNFVVLFLSLRLNRSQILESNWTFEFLILASYPFFVVVVLIAIVVCGVSCRCANTWKHIKSDLNRKKPIWSVHFHCFCSCGVVVFFFILHLSCCSQRAGVCVCVCESRFYLVQLRCTLFCLCCCYYCYFWLFLCDFFHFGNCTELTNKCCKIIPQTCVNCCRL